MWPYFENTNKVLIAQKTFALNIFKVSKLYGIKQVNNKFITVKIFTY